MFLRPALPLAATLPRQIRETRTAIPLLRRLPAVLSRADKPKDATEGLAFARLCYDLSRFAASATASSTTTEFSAEQRTPLSNVFPVMMSRTAFFTSAVRSIYAGALPGPTP